MDIAKPYRLFLDDVQDQPAAKAGQRVADWRPEWCLGQMGLPDCKADCGIGAMNIAIEHISDGAAARLLTDTADSRAPPCVDPIRTGVGPLADHLIANYGA